MHLYRIDNLGENTVLGERIRKEELRDNIFQMARKAEAISGLRRSRRLAGLSPLKSHTENRRSVTKRRKRGSGQMVSSQYCSSERSSTSERGSDDSGIELLDRSSADVSREETDCASTETGQRALSAYYEDRTVDSECTCPSASVSNASAGERPDSRGASTALIGNDESQPSCSSDIELQIPPDEVVEESPNSTSSASHTRPSSSTQRQNLRELAGHPRQPPFGIMQTFSEHISGIPVQGESFCSCSKDLRSKDLQCPCGEEDQSMLFWLRLPIADPTPEAEICISND